MEDIANIQIAVAEYNNIPYCDLYHNSGIDRDAWNIYSASKVALNEKYSPYELDENGSAVSYEWLKYKKGTEYYQIREGRVVLEEYTEAAPYPYLGDQLHKSAAGYKRIGEEIAKAIVVSF